MKKDLLRYVLFFFVFTIFTPNTLLAQDTDNDGVIDSIDLDDDNDGILDIDECPVVMNLTNYSKLTSGVNYNKLKTGDKILHTNAILFDGTYYDLILTIEETHFMSTSSSAKLNTTLGTLTLNKYSYSNDEYVKFSFSLVESGSATTSNTTGIPTTLSDFVLIFYDVDSYSNDNFTEVLGYEDGSGLGVTEKPTSSYLDAATVLQPGGFITGSGPSGSYTYYRMNPATSGNPTTWTDETAINYDPANPDNRPAVFMKFTNFKSVNMVFGLTGPGIGIRYTYYGAKIICDEDNDNLPNRIDIDSDNDGIPDNVEGQKTVGYQPPTGGVNPSTGVLYTYGAGITPEDTDGDGIKDFKDTDSDNDGLLDIEENGMANAVTTSDFDSDGLEDVFEGSNLNDKLDVNDEIDTPSSSILPDGNGDVLTGGDLDYRDIFNKSGNFIVDFDGVDDYISSPLKMSGYQEVTLMAWIKLDANFTTKGDVVGENIFRLFVDNNRKVRLRSLIYSTTNYTDGNSYELISTTTLEKNKWYHIAGTYNGDQKSFTLYINGAPEIIVMAGSKGQLSTNSVVANPNFAIGRLSHTQNNYFKGAIDEVRVFNSVLTPTQIQLSMHQEIENNSGVVKGKIVPKNIKDDHFNATISWNKLQAYYPMTVMTQSKTKDESTYNREATLHNITTLQDQTAPIPYTTSASGVWDNASSWTNGNVWNIGSMKPWSIVKLSHNTTTNSSQSTSSLLIDPGVTLTVNGDNAITNSWYLELNGTIDLKSDSQLIQKEYSNLVTSANGKILRRQEGTNNEYWYNYWSVPVGALGATSYNVNENNATINNSNNTPFRLNMLKNEAGSAMQFTNALQEQNKISKRWLHIFRNGTVYSDWKKITETTALLPGEGYSQKGTAALTPKQGYIFEGKPNNGTVLLNAIKQASSKSTKYLVGNPYASAIDARKFIDDNLSVIDGTIYLWEQWAGNSHETATYEGGYATINKTTTVRAVQFPGIPIAGQTQTIGVKKPTFYLPVGQAFLVRVTNTGDLVFKNSQRVFAKASDADGTPNNGSVFVRKANDSISKTKNTYNPDMQIIRLEFKVSDGLSREFVVAFSDKTTEAYDNGYDSKMRRIQTNDCYTVLDESAMIIQSYSKLTADKKVDILFNSTGDKLYSLKMTEATNIPENQDIYLYDKLTDTYFNLKDKNAAYSFKSPEAGIAIQRFSVVFKKNNALNVVSNKMQNRTVNYVSTSKKLYVSILPNDTVSKIALVDMSGKIVQSFKELSSAHLENGLVLAGVKSGVYVVQVMGDFKTVHKKIIVR